MGMGHAGSGVLPADFASVRSGQECAGVMQALSRGFLGKPQPVIQHGLDLLDPVTVK
jgi:hypothetical protein